MTAGQYIGWAHHDLVHHSGFRAIRHEFPELHGKARIFDAAVVTNRAGRWRLPGRSKTGIW